MRIILCVTNDIVTDRRVNRIALSLMKLPAKVLIIGREFKDNLECRTALSDPAYEYAVQKRTIVLC